MLVRRILYLVCRRAEPLTYERWQDLSRMCRVLRLADRVGLRSAFIEERM